MPPTIASALIGLAAASVVGGAADATPSGLNGTWARGDGNARVRIEPCGPHFCATNIWVKPGRKDESVGDTLVMMVKPESAERYAGKAFDRRRKLTFSMEIAVKPELLTSRGCLIGRLACTSMDWRRIQ